MLSCTRVGMLVAFALAAVGCDKAQLLAPTSSTVTLTAASVVLPTGGSTQLTAFVAESSGTPVQNGTTVRFSTNLGRVDPVEVQTRNGYAEATFLAGDAAGVADVRATSGATGTASDAAGNVVKISVGAAAIDSVSIRANPTTVSPTGGTVDVIALVMGVGGRLLSDIPVSFSATQGTLSGPTAMTDARGEARVTLTTTADSEVTATAGSKSSTVKVTVRTGPSVTLTCAIGAVTNCATATVGDAVLFTASRATATSPIRSSVLDFGDGESVDLGTLLSPAVVAHRYLQAGTFSARLSATDVNGETTAVTQVVSVEIGPAVALTLSKSGMTVTATAAATPSGGSSVSRYDWTFAGDLSPTSLTTAANSAMHTFTSAGTKTVTVRVVQVDGRSTTTSAQITVP